MIATETARVKTKSIAAKLARVRTGKPLRTLDLFAGCGGISLGFHSAGFTLSASVEMEPLAAESHARNFFGGDELHAKAHDITLLAPGELAAEYELGKSLSGCIDVIVGGPPCQAFARVGRAKLREIDDHPTAFKNDARGNLYLRYLHYVEALQPLALLIENVPDMMNYGGVNIAEEVSEVLDGMGYVARYTLLNSAFYGVPQMRERMFLIAYRKELKAEVRFPAAQNHLELPVGYQGSRDVALKAIRSVSKDKLFDLDESHYVAPPDAAKSLPKAVTAREALDDLPKITQHLEGQTKKVARLDTMTMYPGDVTPGPYAKMMREWPGFESREGILEHVIRYLPRDYQIFRVMKPGDQYPQAYQHALALFHARVAALERTGVKLKKGSEGYEALKKSIVPPYDHTKFPNKWRKMEPDQPARTLMAHIGKDTYSHIHYDSEQARTISVREAARLQSFPDGFLFAGSMNSALKQIGNAVPPLMAKAIALEMMKALRDTRMSKIAVKTLTGSDLTLFEWHFRNRNAGNQKSINLNANVFIDELYPYLSNTDVGRVGRIPIDLYLYGPGDARVWNLQRKIIKGGTYKNWRLNGEYIPNPLENPTRFNVLVPGDYAIFEFEGELYPTAARVVFVAQNLPDDAGLYQGLTHHGIDRMAAMELSRLRLIVHASGVPESHPVFELLLDAAIEDAAQGGIEGIRKLQSRATGRKMSRSELERARQRADDVGRMGEELIDGYFGQQKSSGAIQDYEWVAAVDAISPFDFRITAGVREKVEVKSTCGNFLQVIHISVGQLIEMQGAEPYSLYRVYALDERTGKLRIAKGLKPFADSVLLHLNALPAGVKADGISVKPDVFTFGNEIEIELSEDEEPDE